MPYMSVYQKPFASPRVNGGVSGRGGLGAFWGKEWLPSKLFAAGEQGAWYDPSDLSTLFQDAAGTVPVTAGGDPVGRMLDKSGRGNHATQSVSAARPTYQTDGALHWLAFDGVDDFLATAQSHPFGFAEPISIFSGFKKTGAFKTFESLFGIAGSDGAANSTRSLALTVAGGWLATDIWKPAGIKGGTALVAGTPYVAGFKTAAWSTHQSNGSALRVNGGDESYAPYGDTLPLSLAANPMHLGIFNPVLTSSYYTGAMFGMIAVKRELAASEVLSLEPYLAIKSGATLP